MDVDPAKFIVNVVATTTAILSDGTLTSGLINKKFNLDRALMLTEESSFDKMREVANALRIPMSRSLLTKVMRLARGITNGKHRPFLTLEGQPFATLVVTVDEGKVTKVQNCLPRIGKRKKIVKKDVK